jgi:beta-lactamase class A
MITVSSKLAANILIEQLGADCIQLLAHRLDAHSMMVLRGVIDIKAYEAGMNNRTTAIEILTRQESNDGIPAGLPVGTRVAHKTGLITRTNHD